MTSLQEKLLETKVRKIYSKIINESSGTQLDINEVKAILQFVNAISSSGGLKFRTNDKNVHNFETKINETRIQLMNYVEENSQYKFIGKSPSGFKLTKK